MKSWSCGRHLIAAMLYKLLVLVVALVATARGDECLQHDYAEAHCALGCTSPQTHCALAPS